MPVLGDSFTIANFGSRSGSAEYSGLRIDDDLSFVVEEKDDGLILKVVDTSLANDGTAVFSYPFRGWDELDGALSLASP
jgi:hypothetical protein